MKIVTASGIRRFISSQWACMGDFTGARQPSKDGKYFSTSRFTVWQQEVIITSRVPSRRLRSYSRLTNVAPSAVSSASAKPSCRSASRSDSMPTPSKYALKEGATLAITGLSLPSRTSESSVSSTICLAFCGQITKHRPHSIHSSVTICA